MRDDTIRTIILTHGDCDGVCSGALALAANPGARVFFTSPASILGDVAGMERYDRVVACDLAVNISTAGRLHDTMSALARGAEVIYIDHHPLPAGFSAPWLYHDGDSCGALLTFRHFQAELDRDMSRVAMYGAIGDYRDTTQLATELTLKWDKRSLYYEGGIVSQGVELYRRDHDFKRAIVDALARNTLPSGIGELASRAARASRDENDMRLRIEKSVVPLKSLAYVIDPRGSISKAAIYARAYGNTPVGVAAERRDDRGIYDLSARAVRGVDLNVLLDRIATHYGGTGGGHPQAGGARIPAQSLDAFLHDLDEALSGR